jgi:hypothetical protein
MADPVPRDVLAKVRKLAQLPLDIRQSMFAVSVTRLTSLKSLCHEPQTANRFVTFLARKALQRAERGQRHSGPLPPEQDQAHRELMAQGLAEMEGWPDQPSEARRHQLGGTLGRMQAEQNEQRPVPFGAVRLIRDGELLIVEDAARCLLHPHAAGRLAYETARDYTERYHPSHGTGLIPESIPLLEDILEFWVQELGATREALAAPASPKQPKAEKPAPKARKGSAGKPKKARFTHRQGPAEADLVTFFRVTPPAVHGMLVKLDELKLITRQPGVPRSARVVIPEEEIPPLEDVAGPPWTA